MRANGDTGDERRRQSQGTVWAFAAESGAGKVVLDDGTAVDFSASVFCASGLRLLRRGQRVRMTLDERDSVTSMTILTLADPRPSDPT